MTVRVPWRTIGLHLAVVLGLLALAVVAWWHVWVTGHPTSTLTCQCADTSQAVWFLRWTSWSIAHGHNPFVSNAIFAGQGGANMLINTSWLFPGVLLAPVTWLFGPIASFNVAVTIGPVLSGWCMFVLARAITRFFPGMVLAALLWGFSPFLLGGLPVGHFNFTWLFFPPLALLVLYDLLVTRRHRPVPLGVGLGVLVVLEFFTSTELLAMCFLFGAIAALVVVAISPRVAWECRRRALTALGAAAAVSVLALGYPVWFLLEGPRHIVGMPWPALPVYGFPPSSTVEAGTAVHHTSAALRYGGYYGPAFLPAPFLGVGLLAFLGVSVTVWWRRRLAVVLALTGGAVWFLSLGIRTWSNLGHPVVNTRAPHWWLPWVILAHVPLLSNVVPARMSLLVTFAAAVLLALSLDGWWVLGGRAARSLPVGRRPRTVLPGLAATAATAVAAWSMAPIASGEPLPFVLHPSSPPAWFVDAAPHLAPGTVVFVDPDPSSGATSAMGWQAEDAMQIRLVGGYAIVPGRDGRHSANVLPDVGAEPLVDRLSFSFLPLPAASVTNLTMVRSALHSWGVGVVVVTVAARDPAYAVGFLTAAIGRAPSPQDGAWVWDGLGSRPELHLPAGALDSCTSGSGASGSPLEVADCVLNHRLA